MATGGRLNTFNTLQNVRLVVRDGSPASGETVVGQTTPTVFEIEFSHPILPETLDVQDLLIYSGETPPAEPVFANEALLGSDGRSATFTYSASPVTAQGLQTMHMNEGAVWATSDSVLPQPNRELSQWSAAFGWDESAMAVAATDPLDGATLSVPFSTLPSASTAVASLAGMNGGNGGWAVLYGNDPVSPESLSLAVDEDQLFDTERSHTNEQAAFVVFENSGVIAEFLETGVGIRRGRQLADGHARPILRLDGRRGHAQLRQCQPAAGSTGKQCIGQQF